MPAFTSTAWSFLSFSRCRVENASLRTALSLFICIPKSYGKHFSRRPGSMPTLPVLSYPRRKQPNRKRQKRKLEKREKLLPERKPAMRNQVSFDRKQLGQTAEVARRTHSHLREKKSLGLASYFHFLFIE
jgi:hypothetical protein